MIVVHILYAEMEYDDIDEEAEEAFQQEPADAAAAGSAEVTASSYQLILQRHMCVCECLLL